MTKKFKMLVAVILLAIMNITLLLNCVQAANFTTKEIYEIDYCDKVLTFKGTPIGSVYVVYEDNGKEYPAYCITPQNIGVGETDAYDVTIDGNIKDVGLWRVIINGYPYKSIEELGVANEKEAYLATKQAIYSYIRNRGTENYSYIGEAGKRTLNALNQILKDAKNSTETKISNKVEIVPTTDKWQQDKINEKYISKTYKIQNIAPITDYTVEILGENIPEGLIITDTSNKETNKFKQNEEFKILVPINVLNNNGNFQIKIHTKMETKPVLYGTAPDENLQNYALTLYSYEDATGEYKEEYEKNTTKINILKQEKETKNPLQGVEFELLDRNKIPIYQSLVTDKSGKITIEGIEPGIYYLREARALEGYVRYDEDIKVEISLNEIVNITVNNSKEKKIEVSKNETKIEVGKEFIEEKVEKIEKIKKLPVTGM